MATATEEPKHPNEAQEDQYRFWVNSGGEYGRNHESLPGSSVNNADVCRNHGVTPEDMHDSETGRPTAAGQAAIDAEFARLAKRDLTPEEHAILMRVWGLQKRVNDDRFRVYGGRNGDKTWIALCTEFVAFTDDKDPVDVKFWQDLQGFVALYGAEIHVMSEDPHSDSHWNDALPGHEYDPPEGREDRLIKGENHGRMEKQVEVLWRVTDLADDAIVRCKEIYAAASQAMWPLRGVSVI